MLTALLIVALIVALVLTVWACCWLVSQGGFYSFLLAMDLSKLIGVILTALAEAVGGALSN